VQIAICAVLVTSSIVAVRGLVRSTHSRFGFDPNKALAATGRYLTFAEGKLDGTDLAACLEVISAAVKRARAGRPPQLVVATILRLAGHGEHDDASYVSADIKREPFAQDALQRAHDRGQARTVGTGRGADGAAGEDLLRGIEKPPAGAGEAGVDAEEELLYLDLC